MRNWLVVIGLFAWLAAYGEMRVELNNNIVYSNSRYSSQITPPCASNIDFAIGEQQEQSGRQLRKVGPPPPDPYLEPIGGIPMLFIATLVILYVYIAKIRPQTRIRHKFASRHEF